jgi:hypothetical protein
MFSNGALKQLITLEEKKLDHGQLITSVYEKDEFAVPLPFEWQLGSLFVGIIATTPDRVSVFMYVGAVDDNRLCVTIDHAPIPLNFNTGQLHQMLGKIAKLPNSMANREKMYVPTALIGRQGMLPIIPLRADQVATCFSEVGTFKSVRELFQLYDKQKNPLAKARNRLLHDWLRMALVSGNEDNTKSQFELEPTIPEHFNLAQSTTIYNDLHEAFTQGDEDQTFGKLVAEGISNTFSPAFHPEGTQEEGDDVGPGNGHPTLPPTTVTQPGTTNPATAPAPAPATTPTDTAQTIARTQTPEQTTPTAPALAPSPRPTQNIDDSEVQVLGTRQHLDPALNRQTNHHLHNNTHQGMEYGQHWHNNPNLEMGPRPSNIISPNGQSRTSGHTFVPQPYRNMAGPPEWNNNPFGTAATGYGAGFGSRLGSNNGSRHGGPDYNHTNYGATHIQQPTLQLATEQKLEELKRKATRGDITQQDINIFNILSKVVPPALPIPEKDKADKTSLRMSNILGWAGLKAEQQNILHQETNGKWIQFQEAPTKADRRTVVNSLFVQPLIQADPLFESILTDDFADTIMSGKFAPQNFDGMKPSGGLGPLTFISRSTTEHENLQYINRLNEAAKNVSPADIERAKPGTPILPTDVDGTINVVSLNLLAIRSTMTQWSPPARAIKRLLQALRSNYTRFKGMANFKETYSNEIIYQLCLHLKKYFNWFCTEQDLQINNFPKFNIDFLIQGIENNNLSQSNSYGPLFITPRTFTPTQQGTGPHHARNSGTKRNNDGTSRHTQPPAQKDTSTGKISRTGQGCEEQKKLIKEYLKNHEYVPKIADLRIANGFNTDKELSDALGVPEGTCLVWVLYCTCKKKCRRKNTHGFDTTKFKATKAVDILRKGLSM